METLKVSSTSDPSSTAGALANSIRENGKVEVQVIGPKAVNQAIKAIAIARGYIAPSGVDLVSVPQFVDITIDGEERTAIRILIEPRNPISSLLDKGENTDSSEASEDEIGEVLDSVSSEMSEDEDKEEALDIV